MNPNESNESTISININYIGNNMRLGVQQGNEKFVREAVKEINNNYYDTLNNVSSHYTSETILKKMLLEAMTQLKVLQSYIGISKESYAKLIDLESKLTKTLA